MRLSSYEKLVVDAYKNTIKMMEANGDGIEEIQPTIDQLDILIPNKKLTEFLNSVEIEECERCGKLEVSACLRSIGNEDYAQTICEDCYGEQY